jgi:hypothetical protein
VSVGYVGQKCYNVRMLERATYNEMRGRLLWLPIKNFCFFGFIQVGRKVDARLSWDWVDGSVVHVFGEGQVEDERNKKCKKLNLARLTPEEQARIYKPLPEIQHNEDEFRRLTEEWIPIFDKWMFLGAVTPCIKQLKIINDNKTSADGSWNWTENIFMINVVMDQDQKLSLSYKYIFVLVHEMTHAFLYRYSYDETHSSYLYSLLGTMKGLGTTGMALFGVTL